MEQIRTGVSPAGWIDSKGAFYSYKDNCWLDVLLGEGLKVSRSARLSPTVIMITGSPGVGKTTLATELCYRLAIGQPKGTSVYISLEQEGDLLCNNAREFFNNEKVFATASFENPPKFVTEEGAVVFIGSENNSLAHFFNVKSDATLQDHLLKGWGMAHGPRLIVLDSLNSVPDMAGDHPATLTDRSWKSRAISAFRELVSKWNRERRKSVENLADLVDFVVFIDDTNTTQPAAEARNREYMSDIVIDIASGEVPGHDYSVRTIEVTKARYQKSIQGKHVLKIYSKDDSPRKAAEKQHPFAQDGGVFIYPSIHYHLSVYKHKTPEISKPDVIKALHSFKRFASIPTQRASGFIGSRGAHKSHLALLYCYQKLVAGGGVVVVSLRDSSKEVKKELATIGTYQNVANASNSPLATLIATRPSADVRSRWEKFIDTQIVNNVSLIDTAEDEGRLEIVPYHSGYITAEEFFHRALMAIDKVKTSVNKCRTLPGRSPEQPDLVFIFNSLDHLATKFPLCAAQDVFVTGLVEILNAEGFTSIFIAVEEEGQPKNLYGLMPMCDLLLRFSQALVPLSYLLREGQRHKPAWAFAEHLVSTDRNVTMVEVLRRSQGAPAGGRAYFELSPRTLFELDDGIRWSHPGYLHMFTEGVDAT